MAYIQNKSVVTRPIKSAYIQNGSKSPNISFRCEKIICWECLFNNFLENIFIVSLFCKQHVLKLITMIGTIFRALAKNSISLWKRSNCFISVAKTYQKYTFSESLVVFAIVRGIISENILTQFLTVSPKIDFLGY